EGLPDFHNPLPSFWTRAKQLGFDPSCSEIDSFSTTSAQRSQQRRVRRAGWQRREFAEWCSPAGSTPAAAFAIHRRARARDKAFVSGANQTKFRPRQRNKALAGVLDQLVWQRRLSSTPG